MTAAGDIERIRRGYAGWNSGDIEGLLELMDPRVEIHPVLGDVVAADVFRGHDGVRRWYDTVHNSLDHFRVEVQDVRELGDGRYVALVRFTGTGKASGAQVSLDAAHVFTFKDGLVVSMDGYPDQDEALRAAGS